MAESPAKPEPSASTTNRILFLRMLSLLPRARFAAVRDIAFVSYGSMARFFMHNVLIHSRFRLVSRRR
jgi:hypothetical protein